MTVKILFSFTGAKISLFALTTEKEEEKRRTSNRERKKQASLLWAVPQRPHQRGKQSTSPWIYSLI
jgi:hypothetical protein